MTKPYWSEGLEPIVRPELYAMKNRLLYVGMLCAVLSAGCFEMFNQTTTNPTPTVQLLGGTWQSVTPTGTSLVNSCANFRWTATEQSATVVAGNFSATCFGVLQVAGSARGTISGSTINWTATALANGGGFTECAVSLTGTATFDGDQIRVPYTGTTCMGNVSGTEILRKT